MQSHFETMGHAVAVSFADLSTHCYICEEYVEDALLDAPLAVIHLEKFGVPRPEREVVGMISMAMEVPDPGWEGASGSGSRS
ncbi:hypothetical protein HDU67_003179 [Dinochytrium kinnereticum]|nr:hypothetical protein HDU67_003179 [Dinochytrium kinnereticum]